MLVRTHWTTPEGGKPMTKKEKATQVKLAELIASLEDTELKAELRYRQVMTITQQVAEKELRIGNERLFVFPICPRCDAILEREFLAFCNCCGQRLHWPSIKKLQTLYPGERNR